jgi:CRISPR-associated protein Csm4
MSKLLSLTFEAKGGWVTPLFADTIFGHLCWQIARQADAAAPLSDFLRAMDENPAFLISDVFVAGTIPRPRLTEEFCTEELFAAVSGDADAASSASRKSALRAQANIIKQYTKQLPYIQAKDITKYTEAIQQPNRAQAMRALMRDMVAKYHTEDETGTTLVQRLSVRHTSETKTTIDRRTGATLKEQGPFSLPEYRFDGELWLLLQVLDEPRFTALDSVYHIEARLRRVLEEGYGKRKSAGKGFFTITQDWKDEAEIPRATNPTHSLALSNFVPKTNDPTDGLYELFVKYGKRGEEHSIAGGENFYKKPLIMLRHGATFSGTSSYLGRMLTGLCANEAAEDPLRQYGYGAALLF